MLTSTKVSTEHVELPFFDFLSGHGNFSTGEKPQEMHDLNRLLKDRFNEIWINGRFVASITRFNYSLILYSMDGRYVELIYDKSCGKIVWLSLADEADLEKYLEEIKIPSLASNC